MLNSTEIGKEHIYKRKNLSTGEIEKETQLEDHVGFKMYQSRLSHIKDGEAIKI